MESTDSSTGTQQQPNLPPGFRFHPTDEELVVHYLKRKAASAPIPVAVIADIDLYKFDPWELPAKAVFGEHEWYFFSPRDRKYPNGARPNRAATSGYWKATGTDKPVLTANGTQKVGVKKALVFYGGKPPKGIKSNWIMHEYRLAENKVTNKPPGYDIGNKENSLRLDDWVLCRIYKKNNSNRPHDHDKEDSMEDMFGPILPSIHMRHQNASTPTQPKAINFPSLFENNQPNMFDGMLSNATTMSQIASTSSKAVLPLVLPAAANPTGTNNLPLKRTLSSLCWNHEDVTAPSQNKRFHQDNYAAGSCSVTRTYNADNNTTSLATLLSQLPQTSAPIQQGMVGPLGDGVLRSPFQLPGMNWYS